MVVPSPVNGRKRRSLSLRKSKSNICSKSSFFSIAFIVFSISIIGMWVCIIFISPRLITQQHSNIGMQTQPHPPTGKKIRGDGGRSLVNDKRRKKGSGPIIGRYSAKPRVVGMYAYQLDGRDDLTKERGNKRYLPRYMYLTERIDQYLLSHSGQTLRRIRRHDQYPPNTSLSNLVHNYKLAIAGSTSYIKTEDPLKNLMLSSKSRDSLREIADESEDYQEGMAEPLNDEKCEATPQNANWMLHARQTCNLMHEFDMVISARRDKTRILGNGYWRDVWPVLDSEPTSQKRQKKVALKTIRYEHDYTERNFHRHIRDAIVSERLTSSPRVTDIYSFCGNSGYFEFASEGSLADRLEEHYDATVDANSEENMGRGDAKSNDERLMNQHERLNLAYQAASGLADLHDTDPLRDKNGDIISAAMVHADITPDQFVKVGEVFKLNDFNRCRFVRQYRNSGKPCGFYVGSNPGKNRSPEEYAYEVETEKIDVYSLGNIYYTMLTNMDPWEETGSEKAHKAIIEGKRPKIPSEVLSSEDPVDVALRKVMHQCWEHKPEDRPRARALADYLSKELSALSSDKNKE